MRKSRLPGSNSRPKVSEGYEVTSELPGRPISNNSGILLLLYTIQLFINQMGHNSLKPIKSFCPCSLLCSHLLRDFDTPPSLIGWMLYTINSINISTNSSKVWINREGLPILLEPRSRLRIWSRGTDSAVPSRVSLLILHTQAESINSTLL